MEASGDPSREAAAFERYLRRPSRRRLEKLVGLFHGHVWTVALRVAGNREDAADLCQDVFLGLLLRPPDPGTVRSPRGWLAARVVTTARHRRTGEERRRLRESWGAEILAEQGGLPPDIEDLREAITGSAGFLHGRRRPVAG